MSGGDARWRFHRVFRLPMTRKRTRASVDEEFHFHLEGRIEEFVARGLTPTQAEAEALRRFGDMASLRDQTVTIDDRIIEQRRRMDILEALGRETRQAVRRLLLAREFLLTAVLTLGVALGATASIFAMLEAVVLRPLPYTDAGRLVEVTSPVPKLRGDTLWALARHEMYYFQSRARTITGIGLFQNAELTIGRGDALHPSQRVRSALVTASLFKVLDLRPELGRLISEEDNREELPRVVLLGHDLWMRRFAGDAHIIGRSIQLEGQPVVVIGIMPATARLPEVAVELWAPAHVDPAMPPLNNHTWQGVARLRDGASVQDAQAELSALTGHLPELFPAAESPSFMQRTGFHTQVRSLQTAVVGDVMIRSLWLLFGAVVFVLCIATANLSSLFLIRLESRRGEMALRAALGADSVQLFVPWLIECVLVAMLAGMLGLEIAAGGLRLLLASAPSGLPRLGEVNLNFAVLAFTLLTAVLVGMILGLMPVLTVRGDSASLLRDEGRGVTTSRRRARGRSALIVVQVALSLTLLTGAGLMLRSSRNLHAVSPGFDPTHAMTVSVALPSARYGTDPARASAFYEQLLARIERLPGVTAAGVSEKIPFASGFLCTGIVVEGAALTPTHGECPPAALVSPGFFQALGLHVSGRSFTWTGMNSGDGAVVVSRSFAERTWTDARGALGRGLKFGNARPPFYRVTGIADDIRGDGLDKPPVAIVYFPMRPMTDAPLWGAPLEMNLVVRTSTTDPVNVTRSIAHVVSALEPEATATNAESMESLMARSMSEQTFTMRLLAIAATLALFLSIVGLYGITSFVVGQRRRDIAIRMALGAQRAQVYRMVVGHGLRIASYGALAGILCAIASTRLLRALLFGVSPAEPTLIGGAAALLMIVAAAASYVPAQRAASIDPADVLRQV